MNQRLQYPFSHQNEQIKDKTEDASRKMEKKLPRLPDKTGTALLWKSEKPPNEVIQWRGGGEMRSITQFREAKQGEEESE